MKEFVEPKHWLLISSLVWFHYRDRGSADELRRLLIVRFILIYDILKDHLCCGIVLVKNDTLYVTNQRLCCIETIYCFFSCAFNFFYEFILHFLYHKHITTDNKKKFFCIKGNHLMSSSFLLRPCFLWTHYFLLPKVICVHNTL